MISALIAGTGFFASLLSSHDISIPLFLTTVNYSLLIPYIFLRAKLSVLSPWRPWCLSAEEGRVILLGSRAANSAGKEEGSYRSHFRELSCPWWIYALLACVDLEANVIIVSAYRYTSVTSVMLLDCFSIPCVMMLSYLFLKAKYTRTHLIGVFVCLIGMGCIIATDYYSGGGSCDDCSNPFYGDMLCLVRLPMLSCLQLFTQYLIISAGNESVCCQQCDTGEASQAQRSRGVPGHAGVFRSAARHGSVALNGD